MIFKIFNLIYIILLLLTQFNNAKNYYISPANGSMKNDGTFSFPWSTLDSVINSKASMFIGGDTLFLYSGYHGDRVILSTNPTSKIVITAMPNNYPKLLNFTINGSNWVLDKLDFTQEGNDGAGIPSQFSNGIHLIFGVHSRNNIVQNCKFYSTENSSSWSISDWRSNVWSGIMDYGKNNLIKNNYLLNIAYAIQLMQECDSSKVIGNLIENFSGDGIRIGGADYCLIENNIVKNSVELDANSSDGNHEDGIQAWDFGDGVNGLIVRGNLVINYVDINKPFKGVMQGIGFFDGFYNDCIIENNIIIVEHWHGISLYGAKDCKIINNTVLPNPGGSTEAGPPWIGIFPHKDGRNSTGNIVRNNLSTELAIDFGSSTVDHNIETKSASEFCGNFENFDFYPNPNTIIDGISIIDQGTSEEAPSIDFIGVKRPQGNGFDIGAYEYTDSVVSVNSKEFVQNPSTFILYQNYPNPFNPSTNISYYLPEISDVKLEIYDILGKTIKSFVKNSQLTGTHIIVWDGTNNNNIKVSSGIYFFRFAAKSNANNMIYVKSNKLILSK